MTAATPEASSFAPGASLVASIDVADARVEVAGDHEDALRVVGAALDRDDVDDLGRSRQARAGEGLRTA